MCSFVREVLRAFVPSIGTYLYVLAWQVYPLKIQNILNSDESTLYIPYLQVVQILHLNPLFGAKNIANK